MVEAARLPRNLTGPLASLADEIRTTAATAELTIDQPIEYDPKAFDSQSRKDKSGKSGQDHLLEKRRLLRLPQTFSGTRMIYSTPGRHPRRRNVRKPGRKQLHWSHPHERLHNRRQPPSLHNTVGSLALGSAAMLTLQPRWSSSDTLQGILSGKCWSELVRRLLQRPASVDTISSRGR